MESELFAATRNWLVVNRQATRNDQSPIGSSLSIANGSQAHLEIARCPHYRSTPLRLLDDLAQQAHVARVAYKDEASRFGLGSFKALGGAYAVSHELRRHLSAILGYDVSIEALVRREHENLTRDIKVICASDGNHGRSVAAGAQVFGCQCAIYLHEGVSEGRADAIRARGADVVRTVGDYDDSVAAAAQAAQADGCILVADTTADPNDPVPTLVLQGYSVLLREAFEQLAPDVPSHIFVQAGVGGLAAAVVAHVREAFSPDTRPTCVIVEPSRADCLFQSALHGRSTHASGDLNTLMAGLACGEPSALAWPILERGAQAFMLVEDDDAVTLMRALASRKDPIIAGESAVAGLAGLLRAASDPETRKQLGLTPASQVLVFGTEGATDPELYRRLVGIRAEDILSGVPQ